MKKVLDFAPVILGLGLVLSAAAAAAGQNVPVPGVTGTVALEGSVDKEYGAANTIIVKTTDGVKHVFHFTKDLLVHGGKSAGADGLQGLREGTTVVVHYTMKDGVESAHEIDRIGDQGLQVTEGMVTRIDRSRKQIVVRFDNGTSETFRLTERAAADVGKDLDRAGETTKVIVYYTDESGQKVAHFFRKKS